MMSSNLPARRIPCLVYSRIVGYLTPVQFWHDAKRQEFEERVMYDVRNVTDSVTKQDRNKLPETAT